MCIKCFDDHKINAKTTFTVEYNDCIIVIKNVPCMECSICGEITFSDEVSEKLELLVESAKKILQEVAVIDYTKAA